MMTVLKFQEMVSFCLKSMRLRRSVSRGQSSLWKTSITSCFCISSRACLAKNFSNSPAYLINVVNIEVE